MCFQRDQKTFCIWYSFIWYSFTQKVNSLKNHRTLIMSAIVHISSVHMYKEPNGFQINYQIFLILNCENLRFFEKTPKPQEMMTIMNSYSSDMTWIGCCFFLRLEGSCSIKISYFLIYSCSKKWFFVPSFHQVFCQFINERIENDHVCEYNG